ncbi:G-protein alpha subunit [Cyathus striatus]|nr:G-protein alpha subunit [Cyathus striatus]
MGTTDYDPFNELTAPPPDETPMDKAIREQRELEARRVSDKIDEEIKLEKAALKKQKGTVRVLLLGQSESGKSTTLKNFRMRYARTQWKQERLSWRSVIQLNLVRSIITITETLQSEMDNEPIESIPDDPTSPSTSYAYSYTDSRALRKPSNNSRSGTPTPESGLTGKHQLLKLRLGPLRRVEADLKKRLGAGAYEDDGKSIDPRTGQLLQKRSTREFGVRLLQDALEKGSAVPYRPGTANARALHSNSNAAQGEGEGEVDIDDATEIIASLKEDMQALWMDGAVKSVLKRRGLRLEDSAGFFLDDLDRIATRTYQPSDDDVVRARLRTLGVQEYRIQFEQPAKENNFLPCTSSSSSLLPVKTNNAVSALQDFGKEWILYDVGGSRTMRHAWVPYFDNVNAIIFLAPISCFDERLLEDPTVNRLEDSFLLWSKVCSSKLLGKATMILFLNKCDLLKRKLKSGVMLKDYLPNFGERSNDAATVVKYLREKFKDILKQRSPEPRVSYFYPTSVTDTKATSTTLKTVRDSILREHLKSADFV